MLLPARRRLERAASAAAPPPPPRRPPAFFPFARAPQQGRGQALNARDNGCKVVIGLRSGGPSYAAAVADGWKPGVDLLPVADAAKAGSVIMYLLSDAGQKDSWAALRPLLTPGKTLYFSHGFSVVFHKDTGVVPPPGIDVVLVAPKGSGLTLRTLFLEGKGLNSSVAVWQDVSGKAEQRAYALAAAVGSGYMYPTTFEKEVFSDLTGERGILMGAIQGLFKAQYDVLRAKGHSPSEAFNETVEEATQSLYPLIGAKGMDWMCVPEPAGGLAAAPNTDCSQRARDGAAGGETGEPTPPLPPKARGLPPRRPPLPPEAPSAPAPEPRLGAIETRSRVFSPAPPLACLVGRSDICEGKKARRAGSVCWHAASAAHARWGRRALPPRERGCRAAAAGTEPPVPSMNKP